MTKFEVISEKSSKNGHFGQKSHFWKGFCWITSNLSLVLAENFLKPSPKCVLVCISTRTPGKIQNLRFFCLDNPDFDTFQLISAVFGQ